MVVNVVRRSILVLVVAVWATHAQAQARIDSNVVYGMYSGLALLMDVHYPQRPNGFGVLCVPGSGWNAPLGYDASALKDGAEGDGFAKTVMDAGYTLFVVNHRASPRFEYPAGVDDVQRAVRFVRANAARFGIQPNQLGALGSSSGGHLVSMLGVLDGTGDPDDVDPINRLSSKVQAVVALFTPFDLKRVNTPRGGPAVALFTGARNVLTDNTPRTTPESKRYAAASPITYLTADDPPFLLFHGDADETVPFEQSQLMEAGLKHLGVVVKFVPVQGGRHGSNFQLKTDDPRLPAYFKQAADWFDTHLRKSSH
jgi:acetyl esterase/lipase